MNLSNTKLTNTHNSKKYLSKKTYEGRSSLLERDLY